MSSTIEAVVGSEERTRRRHRRYPWDLWTDGRAHELEHTVDFDQDPAQFRNRFYTKARDLQKRAITAHVLHAVNAQAAREVRERLESQTKPYEITRDGEPVEVRSPIRTKIFDLNALIREASTSERVAVLKERQRRLRREGRDYADVLQVQFLD